MKDFFGQCLKYAPAVGYALCAFIIAVRKKACLATFAHSKKVRQVGTQLHLKTGVIFNS